MKEKRGRKVGTFTLGLTLIVCGFAFLLKRIIQWVQYSDIFRFWPCILICLGVEILLAYFWNKEEKLHYDTVSFVLIFLLSGFCFCMAGGELMLQYVEQYSYRI